MKYFNIKALNKSITRIREGNITHEHRSGTAALGLARYYLPVDRFAITSEQIQEFTRKKPDFIEKYINSKADFIPHCFIEVKSLIRENFDNIVGQLFDTLFVAIDDYGNMTGNYSVFMIGVKGTKIAFYMYHSFGSLLDDYGIINQKGFIPLNYLIPEDQYMDINSGHTLLEPTYELYKRRLNFTTDYNLLNDMGAISTKNLPHPHILDLVNEKHRDDIHSMSEYVRENNANLIFRSK